MGDMGHGIAHGGQAFGRDRAHASHGLRWSEEPQGRTGLEQAQHVPGGADVQRSELAAAALRGAEIGAMAKELGGETLAPDDWLWFRLLIGFDIIFTALALGLVETVLVG